MSVCRSRVMLFNLRSLLVILMCYTYTLFIMFLHTFTIAMQLGVTTRTTIGVCVGTSDIPSSVTPQPVVSMSMVNTILALRKQAVQLRTDIMALRNLHLSSIESANLTLDEIFHKAKVRVS